MVAADTENLRSVSGPRDRGAAHNTSEPAIHAESDNRGAGCASKSSGSSHLTRGSVRAVWTFGAWDPPQPPPQSRGSPLRPRGSLRTANSRRSSEVLALLQPRPNCHGCFVLGVVTGRVYALMPGPTQRLARLSPAFFPLQHTASYKYLIHF